MIFPAGTTYASAAHAAILDRMEATLPAPVLRVWTKAERQAAPNWRLIAPSPGFGRHDPMVLALMGQNR